MSDFTLFTGYVRARFGLVIASSRRRESEQKLARLLERGGFADVQALLAHLRSAPSDGPVVAELLDQFAIGETYFFRDPKQLDQLERNVLPAVAAAHTAGPLTLWSAGCATGEEAYTLAMLADRALPDRVCQVVGTDLVAGRLERAREAVYRDYALRRLPTAIKRGFFSATADGRHKFLAERLRTEVSFVEHDLLHGAPRRNVSVILCRNVLIYFEDPADRRVIMRLFFDSLLPRGYLILGHSESCAFETEGFEAAFNEGVLLLRKPETGLPAARRTPFALPPQRSTAARPQSLTPRPPPRPAPPRPPAPAPTTRSAPPAPSKSEAAPPAEPAPPSVDVLLADAYRAADAGDAERAEALARAALEAAPRTVQARVLLASLAERRGGFVEARTLLEEGIFLAPNNTALLFSCAAFYDRLGEPVEAARVRDLARRLVAQFGRDA